MSEWKGTKAVLCFSSGYAAALGSIPALVTKNDVVLLDKLCHASLIDAAKLSGATLRIFPHNNLHKLESHLEWARHEYAGRRVLIVTESVFSMDGDRAPLRELVRFCSITSMSQIYWKLNFEWDTNDEKKMHAGFRHLIIRTCFAIRH